MAPVLKREGHGSYLVRIWRFSCFIDESTPVQTCHLASAHIWTFEVRVKEKIEIEWYFFAWVINAYIHMQLFFPEKKIDALSKFQENVDTLKQ